MKLKKFEPGGFLDQRRSQMVEYLNIALAEGDPKHFAQALGDDGPVRQAGNDRGSPKQTGLGRQSLLLRPCHGDGTTSSVLMDSYLQSAGRPGCQDATSPNSQPRNLRS